MKRILIIGGTGRMGQATADFLKKDFNVFISGRSIEKAQRIANSLGIGAFDPGNGSFSDFDIIFVSVPIQETKKVLGSLLPKLSKEQLLVDLCSVKFGLKLEDSVCEVLLAHQMFGPDESPEGQNMILIPLRGDSWKSLSDYFSSRGLRVRISTITEHNHMTAYTQALVHFISLSLSFVPDVSAFSTPNFRRLIENVERAVKEKEMITSILNENPESLPVIEKFLSSCETIKEKVKDNVNRREDTGN